MAKLAIYRGDTLEREVDLGPRNARIGRGDQNDIVLPDPAKSVSRFHAELRFEDGRYAIVDLNSQNGTWVAGRRVQQVVLEPGIPVVVGGYRLVLVGEAAPLLDADKTMISAPTPPAAAPAAPAARPAAAPPVAAAPVPSPAPPARPAAPTPPVAAPTAPPKAEAAPAAAKKEEPKPVVAPPLPAAAPSSLAPAKVAPKAEPPAAAAVAPKPPAPAPPSPKPVQTAATAAAAPAKAPAPPKALPSKAPGKGVSKGIVFGGFAVLVLLAVAAGLFLWPQATTSTTPSTPTGTPAAQNAPPATPDQAVAQPPSVQPPAAEAAPPPATPVAAAIPAATNPPVTRTEAAVPVSPKAAAPRPVSRTAGGDAPPAAARKAETPRSGRRGAEPAAASVRPRDLGTLLAQARAAMIKGDYLVAVNNLEAIVKVDPKYQDASQMLEMARSGARNAAQLAVDTGTKSEMAGDYDAAIKQYEQAQQLDPGSQPAADAMRRVRARMQADGEDAFKRARQFDALGRSPDAIAMYEKAIKLLPSDHASAKTAKERLAALRGGE